MAATHDTASRTAAWHGAAAVIFGLMAWRGAGLLDARALGVPMLIAGVAGATGALAIVVSVLWQRNRTGTQRAARAGMALAGVAAAAVGVLLAPAGWERGFVISVNVLTGGLLAVFALLAGERSARYRTSTSRQRTRRPGPG